LNPGVVCRAKMTLFSVLNLVSTHRVFRIWFFPRGPLWIVFRDSRPLPTLWVYGLWVFFGLGFPAQLFFRSHPCPLSPISDPFEDFWSELLVQDRSGPILGFFSPCLPFSRTPFLNIFLWLFFGLPKLLSLTVFVFSLQCCLRGVFF